MEKVILNEQTNVRFNGETKIVTFYFKYPVMLPAPEQDAIDAYDLRDEGDKIRINYLKKSTHVFIVTVPTSNISCVTMEPVRHV